MSPQRVRMERVLGIRERLLDARRGEHAEQAEKTRVAEERTREAEATAEAARERVSTPVELSIEDWALSQGDVRRAEAEAKRAQQEERKAQEDERVSQERVFDARRDVKQAGVLRDRIKDRDDRDAAAKESAFTDEVAARRGKEGK